MPTSPAAVPPRQPPRPVDVPEMPDLEAIAAVVSGDREMFEVIVRRYNQALYRVGMAYLRDHAQTEDAMQNTWIKAFLHLAAFRGGAAFSTWLTRIMINECLMTLRRRKTTAGLPPIRELDTEAPAAPDADRAGERLDREEIKAMLETAIAALPRNYRAVYVLREVQQLSIAETAACLRTTPTNVKVLLHRARERLKRDLLKTAAAIEVFSYPAPHCTPMTERVMAAVRALP